MKISVATGDRKYLEPIPRALAYLKRSLGQRVWWRTTGWAGQDAASDGVSCQRTVQPQPFGTQRFPTCNAIVVPIAATVDRAIISETRGQ